MDDFMDGMGEVRCCVIRVLDLGCLLPAPAIWSTPLSACLYATCHLYPYRIAQNLHRALELIAPQKAMARTSSCKTPTLQPYWKCLFGEVFRQDITHPLIKHAYFLIYILLHLPVIFPETFGKLLFGFPDSYFTFDETFLPDQNNGNALVVFLQLIRLTTGLSYVSIFICFSVTIAIISVLLWTDATTKLRPFPWPESWETDNNACYHDMFCEPTREKRLIRRPGNALSNFLYLFWAFVILGSTISHAFRVHGSKELPLIYGLLMSDFIFGVMLLILSVTSIIWHSCNAMWSHAVDLWSMEAVIIYLTFRVIALTIFVVISKFTEGVVIESFVSSVVCLAMFLGHIYNNAISWYGKHSSRFWQDLCPFAVRNRLPDSPYMIERRNRTNQPNGVVTYSPKVEKVIGLLEIYTFALLPVFSNIFSWISIKMTFHTVGSTVLVRILNRSLVFGWTYRLFERWGLDGCWPVQFCDIKIKESKDTRNKMHVALWTAAAALFSPTSALHFWTGVTLIAAFCHSRSVEIFILSDQ